METEEKAALALMQQIRALGKDEIVIRKEKWENWSRRRRMRRVRKRS